jgi:polyisoprenoid-binding protein YceI
MKKHLLTAALWPLLVPAVEAAPVRYILQPEQSSLVVRVYREASIAAALGHDHVVSATGWSGSVVWDDGDSTACAVNINIPVISLLPDTDNLRAQFDLGGPIGLDKRRDILESIVSESQLFGLEFPVIEYRSTACVGDGPLINVSGVVTIRGVGVTVDVPMSIAVNDGRFHATGSFGLNHTDFGFQPFSIMAGAIRLRDEMLFDLDVVGLPE